MVFLWFFMFFMVSLCFYVFICFYMFLYVFMFLWFFYGWQGLAGPGRPGNRSLCPGNMPLWPVHNASLGFAQARCVVGGGRQAGGAGRRALGGTRKV